MYYQATLFFDKWEMISFVVSFRREIGMEKIIIPGGWWRDVYQAYEEGFRYKIKGYVYKGGIQRVTN